MFIALAFALASNPSRGVGQVVHIVAEVLEARRIGKKASTGSADPVRVAVFDLSTNSSGFTMTIFVEGQDEAVETFDVPAGELFIGVEVTDEAGEGISAVRIAPKHDSNSPNGTYWWSMWETRFAL